MDDLYAKRATRAGELLRRKGFPARVQRERAVLANTWEPWASVESLPPPRTEPEALYRLLHLGIPVRIDALSTSTADLLGDVDLCRADGGALVPGRWQLSAFRGLLAAADREYGTTRADVHLGEESLRFTAAVLDAVPTGSVLDVGSGSGISTAAAAGRAEHVTAVDVLDRARDATELTTALNGVAPRCTARVADFRDLSASSFDTVVANLPGVPVPDGMPYPAAGHGGPDGLVLIRSLWRWFAEHGARRLVMRFQSLGNAGGPAALGELADLLAGCEIRVVTDSAAPVLVRDAISAERIAVMAGTSVDDVLAAMAAARAAGGMTHFYCSTLLVDRAGEPGLHHVRDDLELEVSTRHRGGATALDPVAATLRYRRAMRLMPDEFWAVGGAQVAELVVAGLGDLGAALTDGATAQEAARALLPARSGPAARAGADLGVALLARVLVTMSVLDDGKGGANE